VGDARSSHREDGYRAEATVLFKML
jgi:hypothetical protein